MLSRSKEVTEITSNTKYKISGSGEDIVAHRKKSSVPIMVRKDMKFLGETFATTFINGSDFISLDAIA